MYETIKLSFILKKNRKRYNLSFGRQQINDKWERIKANERASFIFVIACNHVCECSVKCIILSVYACIPSLGNWY